MNAFALVCTEQGVIKELLGMPSKPFQDSVDQLFTANKYLIDIPKALNFIVAVKENYIESNWELSFIEKDQLTQYSFSGILHDNSLYIIGEQTLIDTLDDINKINTEFSKLLREVTRIE